MVFIAVLVEGEVEGRLDRATPGNAYLYSEGARLVAKAVHSMPVLPVAFFTNKGEIPKGRLETTVVLPPPLVLDHADI